MKKQRKNWKSVKKAKSENNIPKSESFIKRLIKLSCYFVLFCLIVYCLLWCVAYWKLESYKIDLDEMMSFDQFESISRE